MDHRFASRANAGQQAARGRLRNIVSQVASRPPGRPTTQAIELAGATYLLDRFARLEERANVFAAYEVGTPVVRRRESSRDPSAHRMLVRAQNGGGLGDGVVAMDFDAAAVEPLRHASGRLFDKVADIFDLPSRRARPEFHWLGKAA